MFVIQGNGQSRLASYQYKFGLQRIGSTDNCLVKPQFTSQIYKGKKLDTRNNEALRSDEK